MTVPRSESRGSRQPCARGTPRARNARSAVSDLDSGAPSHSLGAVGHRVAHQWLSPTRGDKDVLLRSPDCAVSEDGAVSSIPPK